ncbi:MAG: TerB family tellurite resistance protein [Gemmatimonadales bacterium]
MLDSVKRFFGKYLEPAQAARPEAGVGHGGPETTESGGGGQRPDPLHLAACALLLELAHADEEFSPEERLHLEEALERHFALPAETARELMEIADRERRRAADLYQFTSLIARRYSVGQKMVLAEVMWRLVYADGELAKHESYLMRKVSNLLGLKPGYLAQARKNALGEEGG